MAAELRWILLGFGIAVIAALWWWERRHAARTAADEPATRGGERFEPRLDPEAAPVAMATPMSDGAPDDDGGDAVRAGIEHRPVPHGDPPLVTLDDLPEDTDNVVLAREQDSPGIAWKRTQRLEVGPPAAVFDEESTQEVAIRTAAPLPVLQPEADAEAHAEAMAAATAVLDEEAAAATSASDEPAPRVAPAVPANAAAPRPGVLAPSPPATATTLRAPEAGGAETAARGKPAEPPSKLQRIVAVRLLATGERQIPGGELKAALADARLVFGRYAIFHRMGEDDRPLFSVASLVEPGTFEPDLMVARDYPGISLFAVFPSLLPAPRVFDDLLATARRLAERLGGVLQDDTGSSLTGQRVLSIREDLVQFEHRVALSRSRPQT